MKNAFKKNPALFIGLALPLLMMLMFSGIPFIASFLVPPPEYNFIYSKNHYYNMEGSFKVDDGKLIFEVFNSWGEPREAPGIYLGDVHSKKSIKLNFALSRGEDSRVPAHKTREFVIEGISLKSLDTSNVAPDGYKIIASNNDNFFSLFFFFGGDRRNHLSLSKSGHRVAIPTSMQGYQALKFEGWVIPR